MHDWKEDRRYLTSLRRIVSNLFTLQEAEDLSLKELSEHASVGYQTLLNLRHGRTRMPRYSTIYGIARGLGVEMMLARPKGQARLEQPKIIRPKKHPFAKGKRTARRAAG